MVGADTSQRGAVTKLASAPAPRAVVGSGSGPFLSPVTSLPFDSGAV